MKIFEVDHFPQAKIEFSAEELNNNCDYLGYIIENNLILNSLRHQINEQNLISVFDQCKINSIYPFDHIKENKNKNNNNNNNFDKNNILNNEKNNLYEEEKREEKKIISEGSKPSPLIDIETNIGSFRTRLLVFI